MNNCEFSLIDSLTKHFFSGSHKFTLCPEDSMLMTWDFQQKLLDATLCSNLNKHYPASSQFTKLYIKKIMIYLEKHNLEVHDDFFVKLCETMKNNNEEYYYRHYLIGRSTNAVITIKETNKMVINGTTGMRTWEAGLILADWVLCNREVFNKQNVIELGSGVGFTGITVAKYCNPKSMYLTDYHSDVLKAIIDNIKINFPQIEEMKTSDGSNFKNGTCEIGVKYLDWNNTDDISNLIVPDIVIGADIVYDPTIIVPLCNVLKLLFKINKNLHVFIASVVRNIETFEGFLSHLDSNNMMYTELSHPKSAFVEWDPNINRRLLKINV